MNILYEHLTIDQKNIWDSYLDLKAKGIKSKAKIILQDFISSVKKNPSKSIDSIAIELDNLNKNHEIEFQFPLFKEIILPTLIKFAKQNKPKFHKMIAENQKYFQSNKGLAEYINKEFGINEIFFESNIFLEKELSINPTDSKTAELLINNIAKDLDYAIHEMPDYGLIYDIESFSLSINKLNDLIFKYDLNNTKWKIRLNLLNTICRTWSDYLKQESIPNYKQYLEALGETDLIDSLSNPREVIYDWKLL